MLIATPENMEAFLQKTADDEELDIWGEDLMRLYGPRQQFRLLWDIHRELWAGGFEQYFRNPTGAGAVLCVDALHEAGAFHAAELLEEAIKLLGGRKFWDDEKCRISAIQCLDEVESERLKEMTEEFFEFDCDDQLIAGAFEIVVAAGIDF